MKPYYRTEIFSRITGFVNQRYVQLGDHVKKGQIVCIVEAMKLMNEIESEFDGEIVEICVNDGDVVEYGMPLFKIK